MNNYEKIGFRCGVEIHNRLATKQKLFCSCPPRFSGDEHCCSITRQQRSVVGERGKKDQAAEFEHGKKKDFHYVCYDKETCLVDTDSEPPRRINQEALMIAFQIAKIFKCVIPDEIHGMRKTVVDGSNTSSFQRTLLIGMNGEMETSKGMVSIENVCLEEESAGIVEKTSNQSVYRLDRIGIPLVEVSTGTDIKDPEHAKEVAKKIGMIIRSTGKSQRGLGVTRQDVNVSIKGGVRVEIKGAQQLDLIPTFVSYEVMRQKNLNKIFAELKNIGMAVSDPTEITKILENSSSKIIKNAFKDKGKIFALKVSNAKGFFGLLIAPGRRFGTEIAGRVKVLGVKGLFHSDELPAYGITQNEVSHIYDFLGCSKDDAFILIAEEEVKALNAINEVKKYLTELKLSKEVRKPLADGTSTFLRPMPGSARMYPETDVPDFLITKDKIDSLPLIELLSNQYELLYKNYGIRESDAKLLFKKDINIQELISKFSNLKPKFIVEFLLDYPKEIKKRYSLDINISLFSNEILNELNSSSISKECSFEILVMKAKGKEVDYSKFKKISVKEVEVIIDGVIKKNPKAPMNALMGLCMAELRGKADGKLVRKILIEKID